MTWWPGRRHGRGASHIQVRFLNEDLLPLVVALCWVLPLVPVWLSVCSNLTSHTKLLGNFCRTLWSELSTCLCLSIKRFNEQCIGQSPTTTRGLTGRLQRCSTSRFLMYTCISTDHVITSQHCSISHPPLHGVVSPLALLLVTGLTWLGRQAFLPAKPGHSLVPNYYCWAVSIWISPSQECLEAPVTDQSPSVLKPRWTEKRRSTCTKTSAV